MPLQIRPYEAADWPAVWALLEPVFRAGETFPHDPAITEAEAQLAWVEQSQAVVVAVDPAGALVGTYYLRPNSLALGAHVANAGYVVAEGARRRGIGSLLCQHSLQAARQLGFRAMQFNLVVGTYYLRPNSLALGAHVANAGYVVAEQTRRLGIGSRLCQHSLQAARRLGFRAMQFNLVVSTNTAGIRCWQRNGFQVVGTLPGAFLHKRLGYMDALVMFQGLVEGPPP